MSGGVQYVIGLMAHSDCVTLRSPLDPVGRLRQWPHWPIGLCVFLFFVCEILLVEFGELLLRIGLSFLLFWFYWILVGNPEWVGVVIMPPVGSVVLAVWSLLNFVIVDVLHRRVEERMSRMFVCVTWSWVLSWRAYDLHLCFHPNAMELIARVGIIVAWWGRHDGLMKVWGRIFECIRVEVIKVFAGLKPLKCRVGFRKRNFSAGSWHPPW